MQTGLRDSNFCLEKCSCSALGYSWKRKSSHLTAARSSKTFRIIRKKPRSDKQVHKESASSFFLSFFISYSLSALLQFLLSASRLTEVSHFTAIYSKYACHDAIKFEFTFVRYRTTISYLSKYFATNTYNFWIRPVFRTNFSSYFPDTECHLRVKI